LRNHAAASAAALFVFTRGDAAMMNFLEKLRIPSYKGILVP
jgi:hypothetical protein